MRCVAQIGFAVLIKNQRVLSKSSNPSRVSKKGGTEIVHENNQNLIFHADRVRIMVPCVTAAWISVNSGPDGSRVLLYSFLIILSTCQKVTSWKQVLFSVYNSLMRPTLASTAYHGSLQLPTGAIRCHPWRPINRTWSSRAWSHRKS